MNNKTLEGKRKIFTRKKNLSEQKVQLVYTFLIVLALSSIVYAAIGTSPTIEFGSPTPSNGTQQTATEFSINLSTGTNEGYHYSFIDFDRDVLLWLTMEEVDAEEDPLDNSSYGRDLAKLGVSNYTSSGRFGQAYELNTSGSGAVFSTTNDFNMSNNYSVSIWVNHTRSLSTADVIIKKSDNSIYCAASSAGFSMFMTQNTDLVSLRMCNVSNIVTTSATIAQQHWHHLVITYDGINMRSYINGTQVGSPQSLTGGTSNEGQFSIGNVGNFALNGSVDEVLVINRTLNETEVFALYNATATQYFRNFSDLSATTHRFTGYTVDNEGDTNRTVELEVTVFVNTLPYMILNAPANDSSFELDNLSIVLNVSFFDFNDDVMTVRIFGGNSTTINPEWLLYYNETVSNASEISYNWSSPVTNATMDGLVALYHFDNRSEYGENGTHVLDFSNNGHNGTVYGTAIQYNESIAKFGRAMSFPNATGTINTSNPSTIDNLTNLTYAAWIYPTQNYSGAIMEIVSKANNFETTKTLGWGGIAPAHIFEGRVATNGTDAFSRSSGNIILAERWQFIAMTYDEGGDQIIRLYYNGEEISSYNSQTAGTGVITPETSAPLRISGRGGSVVSATLQDTTLDEVSVWNKSLNQEEIRNLYRLGEGRYYWHINVTDQNNEQNISSTFEFLVNNTTIPTFQPYIDFIAINSTNPILNYTSENITAHATANDSDGDPVTLVYNWFLNNVSYPRLNMPFEIGSNATFAKDYSGYSLNGTVSGAVYNETGGFDGRGAYEFDGINDYIATADIDQGDPNQTTIMLWFKANPGCGGNAAVCYIVSKGQFSGQGAYTLTLNENGNVTFTMNQSTLRTDAVGNDSQWHHVAAVRNGTNMTVYVDGQIRGSRIVAAADQAIRNNEITIIGSDDADPSYRPFNGTIDEVMIFNITLGHDQILTFYNNRTDVIHAGETEVGDAWRFRATPNDGNSDGPANESTELIVLSNEVPYIILNNPANDSNFDIDDLTIVLNATPFDFNAETITLRIFGGNSSTINPEWLLYINNSVSNGSDVNYNWSSPVVNSSDLGLVGLWHLDNRALYNENSTHAFDFSNNGNNGTINNTVFTTDGKIGGAFFFDGDADHITLPESADDNIATNYTLSVWVKPTNVTDGERAIMERGNETNSTPRLFLLDHVNASVRFIVIDNTGSSAGISAGSALVADDWTHVAAVREENQFRIYINGLLSTNASASLTSIDEGRMIIGAEFIGSSTPSDVFNGTLDEVAVWNRSLNDEEVKNLYRLSVGRYYWHVNITDQGGLQNQSQLFEFSISNNTNPPSVNLSAPANNTMTMEANVSFNASFVDDQLLVNATFYLWNESDVVINTTTTIVNGTSNSTSVTATLPYQGTFYWNYLATDNNSDTSFNESNFSIVYSVEMDPPNVTAVSATPDSINLTQSTTINASIADDQNEIGTVIAIVTLANGTINNFTMTNNTGTNFNTSISTTATHPIGSYNVTIYANDSVSNLNNSENISFTVNALNIVPYMILNAPANNSNFELDELSIILNATALDFNADSMAVRIFGGNSTTINPEWLLYVNYSVDNGSEINYNWSSPIINASDVGLVALYHFDNRSEYGENNTHVFDFSLEGNNGTVLEGASLNGSYTNGSCKFGECLFVDGNDDNSNGVDLGQPLAFNVTEGFTIAAWTHPRPSGEHDSILAKGAVASSASFMSYYLGRHVGSSWRCSISNGTELLTLIAGSSVTANTWQHVACNWNGSELNIYKDGLVIANTINTTFGLLNTPTGTAANVGVGGDFRNNDAYYNGSIDELGFWNRSLSQEEIRNLYRVGPGRYYWHVNLTDQNGAQNLSEPLEFVVLNTSNAPPVVTLSDPANATIINGNNMSFNASFTDDQMLVNATFYLWNESDAIINTTTNIVNGTSNSSSTTLTFPYIGTFYWNYLAADNNSVTSFNTNNFSISYAFETLAPNVTSVTATPSGINQSQSTTINASIIDDGSALDSVIVIITIPNGTMNNLTMTNNSADNFNATYTVGASYPLGTYNVTIYANDSVGNLNNSENISFIVNMQNAPPTVNLSSPPNATVSTTNNVSFNASFTDDQLLVNATFYLWNESDIVINTTTNIVNGTSNTSSTAITLPYVGTFYWNYLASDSNGEIAFNESNFSISYSLETLAPNVTSVSTTPDGINQSQSTTINASIIDDGSTLDAIIAIITIPNGTVNNLTMTNNSADNFNATYTVGALYPLGTYNVTIYANDSVGNLNDSETTNFTVSTANLPANITINDPPNASVYNLSQGIELNITVFDNTGSWTVRVFASNGTENTSIGLDDLIYYNTTVPRELNFTYNFTAPVLDTGWVNDTLVLYHFDEREEYGENSTHHMDFAGNLNLTLIESSTNGGVDAQNNITISQTEGKFAAALYQGGSCCGVAFGGEFEQPYAGPVTHIMWLKPRGVADLATEMVFGNRNASGQGLTYGRSTTELIISANTSSGGSITIGNAFEEITSATGVGNWTHMALVFHQNNSIDIYVDGVFIQTNTSINVSLPSGGTNLTIGGLWNGTGAVNLNSFTGFIDEFMIINQSLNYSQVLDTYRLRTGNYSWFVNVTDGFGESVLSSTQTFTVVDSSDMDNPNVTNAVALPSNLNQSQSSTINASIVDNLGNISSATVSIVLANGTITNLTMTNNNASNYNATFTTDLAYPIGTYNLTIYANDTSNNLNDSTTLTLTVNDVTNPNVTLIVPPANIEYNVSQVIEVAANVSDNTLVSAVLANITLPNGTENTLTLSQVGSSIKYNTSYTVPVLVGVYNLSFIANDSSNNINDSETTNFSVIMVSDAIAPVVTITAPINNSNSNQNANVTISANVTDAVNISSVLANITLPNSTIVQVTLINETTEIYNTTFTQTDINGSYLLRVIANDSSNNINDSETVVFTVGDFLAPNVTIINPINGTDFTQNNNVSIEVNVSDEVNISSVLANITLPNSTIEQQTLIQQVNNVTWLINFTNTSSVGTYTLRIIANDTNNLVNSTEFVTFTISSPSSGGGNSGGGGGSAGGRSSAGSALGGQGYFPEVAIEETKTVSAWSENIVAIERVEFSLDTEAEDVFVKIWNLGTLPSGTKELSVEVYEYDHVEITNIQENSIEHAKVYFHTRKQWLEEEQIEQEDIKLYIWNDEEWIATETTIERETSERVYYSSEVEDLGYLTIALFKDVKETPIVEEIEEVIEEVTPTKPVQQAIAEEPSEVEKTLLEKLKHPAILVSAEILLFLVLVLLTYGFVRRRMKKPPQMQQQVKQNIKKIPKQENVMQQSAEKREGHSSMDIWGNPSAIKPKSPKKSNYEQSPWGNTATKTEKVDKPLKSPLKQLEEEDDDEPFYY